MRRILLTGMSGTGKSSLISRLAELGYRAVDLDEPAWSEYDADGDWIWREDRVQGLLSQEGGDVLFVSGCPSNQVKFYSRFEYIILLSAPPEVLVERLRTRTNNPYGKHPDELADVLAYVETVEPRLRRVADHEVDTTIPLDDVAATVLRLLKLSS